MHTFKGGNIIFLLHKLLLNISFLNYLDCVKLLKFPTYCIAKNKGIHILINNLSISCHHKQYWDFFTFRSNIHVFIYFDDNDKIKNGPIICFVKNKF